MLSLRTEYLPTDLPTVPSYSSFLQYFSTAPPYSTFLLVYLLQYFPTAPPYSTFLLVYLLQYFPTAPPYIRYRRNVPSYSSTFLHSIFLQYLQYFLQVPSHRVQWGMKV